MKAQVSLKTGADTKPIARALADEAKEGLPKVDVEIIHAGHEPSFGKAKLQKTSDDYFLGKNSMPADPITWFNEISNHNLDNYSNQNWTLNKILNE